MPPVLTPNEQWLSAKIAALEQQVRALAADRTEYTLDNAGVCQAIEGSLQFDNQGNPTGLGNVWGFAVFNGSHWAKVNQADTAGVAAFLQLLSAQELQLAFGSSSWSWPGATNFSSNTTVTHSIGRSPAVVLICPSPPNLNVQPVWVVESRTTTQFVTGAYNGASQPGAGTSVAFDWLAIG